MKIRLIITLCSTSSSIQSSKLVTLSNSNLITLNLGFVEKAIARSKYLMSSPNNDFFCKYGAP